MVINRFFGADESTVPAYKAADRIKCPINSIVCVVFLSADIDECLDASVCVGGQCVNTDGSYMCFCTHPMVFDPDSNHCVFGPEVAGKNVRRRPNRQSHKTAI